MAGRAWPTLRQAGARRALILAVYLWQGLAASFAVTALPIAAAAGGASTTQIGAHVAAIGLPWVLQPLWGPLVDRFGGWRMGRRRFWVVGAMAASLLLLAPLPGLVAAPGLPAAVTALFVGQAALASLLDTALDALMMDRVPPGRFGEATALTRIGFTGGAALGAAGFGWMIAQHGAPAAAALLLGCGMVLLAVPLLLREAPGDALVSPFWHAEAGASGGAGWRELGATLRALLARPETRALLLLAFAFDMGAALLRVRLQAGLVQEGGFGAEELSRLMGLLGLAAGTAGALAVGWWSDRAGPGRALALLLAATLAGLLAGAALLRPGLDAPGAAAVLGLATVLPALAFVALAPVVMRAARGPAAATGFALYMATLNAGDVAGSAAAGPVGTWLDPAGQALAAAALVGLAVVVAWRLRA